MKKYVALLCIVTMLSGCACQRQLMDRCMALRAELLASEGCSFQAEITADYGDAIQEFTLKCLGKSDGALGFEVLEPDSISGITGRFSGDAGQLTFDDVALQFPLLADGSFMPARVLPDWTESVSLRNIAVRVSATAL